MLSDDIRASDSDREDAVGLLCEAYAAGRIDLGDIGDRATAAYRARTWGDLRRLTADLPPPGHFPAGHSVVTGTRSRTRRHDRPGRPIVPVLLTVVAWMAMAAAAFMPVAGAPLAVLPLSGVSMAALFAAGRIAGRPGDQAGGKQWYGDRSGRCASVRRYKFQALITLYTGSDGSPVAGLGPEPRRMVLRSRAEETGRSQVFNVLVSCDDLRPFRPGSRRILATLRLAGDDVADYLCVGGHFGLWLGRDVGEGMITRRLFV